MLRSSFRAFSSKATAGKKVLIMGLSGPTGTPQGAPGGLTKDKLLAILAQQNEELKNNGFAPTMLLLDPAEDQKKNAAMVIDSLQGNSFDVVSIGAGVRTFPEHFLLFETLVNLVHVHAPGAGIAFDRGPGDIVESIIRLSSGRSEET